MLSKSESLHRSLTDHSYPISVTLFAFDHALSSTITGVLDLLSMVGVAWNQIHGLPATRLFDVKIASLDGNPVRCINGITLNVDCALSDIMSTDLLLVPSIGGDMEKVLQDNQAVLPLLRYHHQRGVDIAGNCSGTFFLAEAGLLDGKVATTYWGYKELFKQRYPNVKLKSEQLITEADAIYCSGGGMAWLDLILFMIERFCGHEVAREAARSYVIDIDRNNPSSSYSTVRGKKYHQDVDILSIQDWMENHFQEDVNQIGLAEQCNLSLRTFKRRFKCATGETPLQYLQSLRIEAAKKLLVTSLMAIEDVTHQVGYEDLSSFTKLFKKHAGVTPAIYRNKFKRGRVVS
ncbi:MAG: helix-turn-helix domain-containing protein [Oleispira sp.]|nr:helix-turn-helix domain-containing protein [Oleispira sp.]MBL4879875.1 helix-turn-helix domain-containing protein [Oleispira sp.]